MRNFKKQLQFISLEACVVLWISEPTPSDLSRICRLQHARTDQSLQVVYCKERGLSCLAILSINCVLARNTVLGWEGDNSGILH